MDNKVIKVAIKQMSGRSSRDPYTVIGVFIAKANFIVSVVALFICLLFSLMMQPKQLGPIFFHAVLQYPQKRFKAFKTLS